MVSPLPVEQWVDRWHNPKTTAEGSSKEKEKV
jgi:hypothetical protein